MFILSSNYYNRGAFSNQHFGSKKLDLSLSEAYYARYAA